MTDTPVIAAFLAIVAVTLLVCRAAGLLAARQSLR